MARTFLAVVAFLLLAAPAQAQWEWSVPRAPAGAGLTLGNVACGKPASCAVVAADAQATYVLTTLEPARRSQPWTRVALGPPGIAADVECARGDAVFCAVAGGNGPLTLWTSADGWKPVPVPIQPQEGGRVHVACTSSALCVVGAAGLAVWTPSGWTTVPSGPVSALACASSGRCTAATTDGEVLVHHGAGPADWIRYRVEAAWTSVACTFVGCVGTDGARTYGMISIAPPSWITRPAPPGLASMACAPRAFCAATTTSGELMISRGLGNYEPTRTPGGPFHSTACVTSDYLCLASSPTAITVGAPRPYLAVPNGHATVAELRRGVEVRIFRLAPRSTVTVGRRTYKADDDGTLIFKHKVARPRGRTVRVVARARGVAGIEHRLEGTITSRAR